MASTRKSKKNDNSWVAGLICSSKASGRPSNSDNPSDASASGAFDAKGPNGVQYAQGQGFTFTVNLGSGVRYNFSPRYAISAGVNRTEIS